MINCYAITEQCNLAVLTAHLKKNPLTKLVGWYNGKPLKYSEIMNLSIQVVFIDQSLCTRFKQLLTKLSNHILIVYLAESQDMAYQAFEDGVLDFIPYPFNFARFEKCINKLIRFSLLMPTQPYKQIIEAESFFVKPDPKGKVELLINCDDVLFIEAYQNDVAIQMVDGRRFICLHTMKEMEESLSSHFMRIHKSFIINYKKITAFDGSNIIIEADQHFRIPLGNVYKRTFMDRRNTMVIRKSVKEPENYFLKNTLSCILMFFIEEMSFVDGLFTWSN